MKKSFKKIKKRLAFCVRLLYNRKRSRTFSSAGRAFAWRAKGQRFESVNVHHKNRAFPFRKSSVFLFGNYFIGIYIAESFAALFLCGFLWTWQPLTAGGRAFMRRFCFRLVVFLPFFIVCAFCTSFISNICYCWLVVIKIHKWYNEMGCLWHEETVWWNLL